MRDGGAFRLTPTLVADRDCEVDAEIVTVGTVTPTDEAALCCNWAFETLTVREPGAVLLTPTPVADSACDVDAEIVTVGRVTATEDAALACSCAFDTLTVREGGGVLSTPTKVEDTTFIDVLLHEYSPSSRHSNSICAPASVPVSYKVALSLASFDVISDAGLVRALTVVRVETACISPMLLEDEPVATARNS